MKLFLDCDGVLANFDKLFEEMAGHPPREYEAKFGTPAFWKLINRHEDGFFRSLEKMPDAEELVEAVRHLNPTILTGVPSSKGAQEQKLAWRDEHFPGIEMICCLSKDKYLHMHEDKHNIIVDDWDKYKHIWEGAGGTFVLHTSASESISELREMGVLAHGRPINNGLVK